MADAKSEGAFRTISEVSAELGIPAHILRYWETRFPQLRPLTRAGNRRYYRPTDVALVRRIDQALHREGYSIKGVQKLLRGEPVPPPDARPVSGTEDLISVLIDIRDELRAALRDDL